MQTCITSTTRSAPLMPPLEAAASEKLASGVLTTLIEANVWQTRTFTPELRWGNDYMHARYYNLNLGRFLSVDPIGGTVGSSQSWNRYSYVLNNPLNLIDPFGLAECTRDVDGNYAGVCTEEITVTAEDPDKEKERKATQDATRMMRQMLFNTLDGASNRTYTVSMGGHIADLVGATGEVGLYINFGDLDFGSFVQGGMGFGEAMSWDALNLGWVEGPPSMLDGEMWELYGSAAPVSGSVYLARNGSGSDLHFAGIAAGPGGPGGFTAMGTAGSHFSFNKSFVAAFRELHNRVHALYRPRPGFRF